ncbi:unnamed protein product [Penicillium salamii]|nr:unnamed protein product [Penicillium salamii]
MQSAEGLTHQGGLVDSDDEHRQSSEKRLARDCHAEHETSDPLDQRFDLIPAYTRYSSYHLAAATYLIWSMIPSPKLMGCTSITAYCCERNHEIATVLMKGAWDDIAVRYQSQTDVPLEGVSKD